MTNDTLITQTDPKVAAAVDTARLKIAAEPTWLARHNAESGNNLRRSLGLDDCMGDDGGYRRSLTR